MGTRGQESSTQGGGVVTIYVTPVEVDGWNVHHTIVHNRCGLCWCYDQRKVGLREDRGAEAHTVELAVARTSDLDPQPIRQFDMQASLHARRTTRTRI